MRKLLALVVLLSLAGAGRADDEAIVKQLQEKGAAVIQLPISGANLYVQLDANNLDATLPDLCELRGLHGLGVRQTRLTDKQVQQVCALPGGKTLDFIGCPITDAQLKIVAGVRGLEGLGLADTAITDEGLAELTRLGDLESLTLHSASITDVGLRHLEGMRGMFTLQVGGCPKITDAGVARLQRALPNCTIYR
jgi:hypothetical protein